MLSFSRVGEPNDFKARKGQANHNPSGKGQELIWRRIFPHRKNEKYGWLVFDHARWLAEALAMVSYWGREKYIFNLLIFPSGYWQKRVDFNLYKDQFDEIILLERPMYFSSPFRKPLADLKMLRQIRSVAQIEGRPSNIVIVRSIFHRLQSILLYPVRILGIILKILRVKKRISSLKIQPSDIIIGFAGIIFGENIVISMHPKNLKIAVMHGQTYEECTRPIAKKFYTNTVEGWLANWIIEPLTGLHRTYYMKDRLHQGLHWWARYRKPLLEIYDKAVVLGNFPSQTGSNILTMPFPYVLGLKKTRNNHSSKEPQKVVFFGTDFLGFITSQMEPEVYVQKLNACLSFLREKFGSTYKLVYRPHPADTAERHLLDLNQFEIEDDGMLSELYLYRNIDNIHAVFSDVSSSSRSALHFFINAYSFLNLFPYDEAMKHYFRLAMGNVPDDFYINDLSMMPKRYVQTENTNETIKKCQDVLDSVLRR